MAKTISPPRDLVALNADVVDYSRLMADDLATTTETMNRYHALVAAAVASAGGTLVNFVGDNFMAVFDGVKEAIGASIAITSAIEQENESIPRDRKLRFRMGLDKGPVTATNGDYFGDALNIAARIQALARPGGVSVSGAVFRELDEPALRFRSTGVQHLKNIPEAIEVFEFADLPKDDEAPIERSRLSLSPPTIAMLPIHRAGTTPETESIPDLMRSEILHRLAGVPNVRVLDVSVESTERPTQSPEYLMETGLLQYEEQARFYAKLMEVATLNIVTSHKWNGSPAELARDVDEIADVLAEAVEVELIIGEPAREYRRLYDPEATRRVFRGWYHLTTDTAEGTTKAIELFESVAEAHPDKPYGAALAAFAHWVGAAEGILPDASEHYERATALAQRAAELGDTTGLAQMVQAAILMSTGQPGNAATLLESVEITRPTCDVTYGLAGSVRRYLGEWEKAVDLLDVAMRLTAMNKPWYPTIQACSWYMGHRLEAAASTAQSVLDEHPRNLEALLVLAAAQVELGQLRRAKATAAMVRERFPAVDIAAWLEGRPYQDPGLVERWKTSLAAAGLLDAERDHADLPNPP